MSNSYPKWKYHASKPATVVHHEDAEKDLGKGWHDEPVKDNLAVDQNASAAEVEEESATMTGDEVFDQFLADNEMEKVPAKYQAMIRTAYDHVVSPTAGTIPAIEYGHPVGPQDEVVMVDKKAARDALFQQATDMGLKVHHMASSKTIQTAIDAHTAVKSSTPAAPRALPKDTDLDME